MCEHFAAPFLLGAAWVAAVAAALAALAAADFLAVLRSISLQPAALAVLRLARGARIQGKILNSNNRNSLKFVHHSLWHIRGHFKVKTWCPQDAGLHSVSFQTASSNHTNISPTLSLDLERLCL